MEPSEQRLPSRRRPLFIGIVILVVVALIAAVAWAISSKSENPQRSEPTVKTFRAGGVSVEKYSPAEPSNKPPIIMVHGGQHGKWQWEKWAPFFSKAGYEVYTFDWYNHGDSDKLPEDEFIKRSIVEVARNEIKEVAGLLNRKPILIGHSMGGLASAVYAETAPIEKLVLLAPVMPSAVHPDPVPLPIDMTKPFDILPYNQARKLFFTALDEEAAHRAQAKLVPESPQAVHEASYWTIDVNLDDIKVPKLVFGTELDVLTPAVFEEKYAKMMGGDYKFIPKIGHSDILLKNPEWREAAQYTLDWLNK